MWHRASPYSEHNPLPDFILGRGRGLSRVGFFRIVLTCSRPLVRWRYPNRVGSQSRIFSLTPSPSPALRGRGERGLWRFWRAKPAKISTPVQFPLHIGKGDKRDGEETSTCTVLQVVRILE